MPASGCITRFSSKSEPTESGCQYSGKIPFGIYIAAKRCGRFAAVRACAVSAGTIASRKGSATVAPNVPTRNVRRDKCFLVMNMATPVSVSLRDSLLSGLPGFHSHLERRTFDDALDH